MDIKQIRALAAHHQQEGDRAIEIADAMSAPHGDRFRFKGNTHREWARQLRSLADDTEKMLDVLGEPRAAGE